MSSTIRVNDKFFLEIRPIPIPLKNYNNIAIEDYDIKKISKTGYKGYDLYNKCSESPNIPTIPLGGNTPPDTSYIKLIYLNYLASKSLEKNLYKLN